MNILMKLFLIILVMIFTVSCDSQNNEKYKQEEQKIENQLEEKRQSKIEERENLQKQIDSLKQEKAKKAEELKKANSGN